MAAEIEGPEFLLAVGQKNDSSVGLRAVVDQLPQGIADARFEAVGLDARQPNRFCARRRWLPYWPV